MLWYHLHLHCFFEISKQSINFMLKSTSTLFCFVFLHFVSSKQPYIMPCYTTNRESWHLHFLLTSHVVTVHLLRYIQTKTAKFDYTTLVTTRWRLAMTAMMNINGKNLNFKSACIWHPQIHVLALTTNPHTYRHHLLSLFYTLKN